MTTAAEDLQRVDLESPDVAMLELPNAPNPPEVVGTRWGISKNSSLGCDSPRELLSAIHKQQGKLEELVSSSQYRFTSDLQDMLKSHEKQVADVVRRTLQDVLPQIVGRREIPPVQSRRASGQNLQGRRAVVRRHTAPNAAPMQEQSGKCGPSSIATINEGFLEPSQPLSEPPQLHNDPIRKESMKSDSTIEVISSMETQPQDRRSITSTVSKTRGRIILSDSDEAQSAQREEKKRSTVSFASGVGDEKTSGVTSPTPDSPLTSPRFNFSSSFHPTQSSNSKDARSIVRALPTDDDDDDDCKVGEHNAGARLQRVTGILRQLKATDTLDFGKKTLASKDDIQTPTSVFFTRIVSHRRFDMVVAWLILANAGCLGAEVDHNMQSSSSSQPEHFRWLNRFFAIVFTTELCIRFAAEGKNFFSRYNQHIGWNLLDLVLVLLAIVEEIFSHVVADVKNSEQENGSPSDISAVRLVRILRLVRIVRVIRVMRFFRDLRLMVYGIMNSLKSLVWCLLLLLLIMYIFSVFLLQLVQEGANDLDPDGQIMTSFGTLLDAVFTLYMSISGGLDWGQVAVPLKDMNPILAIFFCIYIAFAIFCVLNIITGVFVENSTNFANHDEESVILEELQHRQTWFTEVKKKFHEADSEGEGCLDWPRFKSYINDIRVRAYFRSIGLDVEATGTKALFHLLDFDGNGSVDVDEFVLGCAQLRGNARSLDIARLRHENKNMQKQLQDLLDICTWEFDYIRTHLHEGSFASQDRREHNHTAVMGKDSVFTTPTERRQLDRAWTADRLTETAIDEEDSIPLLQGYEPQPPQHPNVPHDPSPPA